MDSTLPDAREFATWLRDAGLSRAQARRVVALCYKRLFDGINAAPEPADAAAPSFDLSDLKSHLRRALAPPRPSWERPA